MSDTYWPLTMVRTTLADIPVHRLPPGYAFHWYQPGDEVSWVAIQSAADRHNEITPQLFAQEFRTAGALAAPLSAQRLEDRQCYLLDPAGLPIGTATAWVDDLSSDPTAGRVHWVAVVPVEQGKGLAKPLMTVVCQRLRALGHRTAYLTTAMNRLAAIGLYLKFGFMPVLRNDEDQARWRKLQEALQQHLRR